MKKYAIILLLTQFGFSQAPALEWQKCLGGSNYDISTSIEQTTDGGYIVAGYTASNNGDVSGVHGGSDAWVVKLSSSGMLEWQKAYGGSGSETAQNIQQTTDGGYIVACTTNSANGDVTGIHGNGGTDGWLMKLSSSGTIEWQKVLGGFNNDYSDWVQQTPDGGYIVACTTNSTDGDVLGIHGTGATSDAWVVKLSNLGLIEWQKALGGTANDAVACIQTTTDGGYITTGYTNSNNGDVSGNHGSTDIWVVKLSSLGLIEWQKALGGTAYDSSKSVLQTTDGGYVLACNTGSTDGDVSGNNGNWDAWIVKLSSLGTLEWQKAFGGSESESALSIKKTTDGGYIVTGFANSTNGDVTGNHGLTDVWILKFSSSGTLQWQKAIGGEGNESSYSIQPTTDGGYILAGYASYDNGDVSGNHGSFDYWVVKLGTDILVNTTLTNQLFKIYPNPTAFVLYFQNHSNSSIDNIIVTDLAGKIVLVQSENSNQINVEKLARGMYVIQVFSGEEKVTHKFVKE